MSRSSTLRSARRPLAAAAALAAAATLAACGSSSSGTSTNAAGATGGSSSGSSSASGAQHLRIGFSPFTLQVPALKGLSDGLTAAGKASGDTVVAADPKGDPSTQLQQLQQWVQLKQVDAIWVIPVAGKTIAPVLQQALTKGIVVIASGKPADYGMSAGTPGITFTQVDNTAYGTKLGELTAQCITQKLAGAGQVVYLQSPSGQQSTGEINDSFLAALQKNAPQSKVVNKQAAKDRLGSQQEVSSALQGAPGANTLVGTDDESTLGGLAAFQQAGKDASKMCVVGAGGNAEAQQAVKDGKVFADIAFDFQKDLGQNLGELHSLAANPKVPGKQLVTPIQVITQNS